MGVQWRNAGAIEGEQSYPLSPAANAALKTPTLIDLPVRYAPLYAGAAFLAEKTIRLIPLPVRAE